MSPGDGAKVAAGRPEFPRGEVAQGVGDDRNRGAHHRRDLGQQVKAALAGAARHAGEDLLRGVDRRVDQEEEHGIEFGGEAHGEASGVVERRGGLDPSSEPRDEPAAGPRGSVLAGISCVAALVQVESRLQDRLRLVVHRAVEAAIQDRPLAHQQAAEFGVEHGGRVMDTAARADGLDLRCRAAEPPEPVPDGAEAPPGLAGYDHQSLEHLFCQHRVEPRRIAGDPMQQVHQTAPGAMQADRVAPQVRDLRQRRVYYGLQFDRRRADARAELYAGRAEHIGVLPPMLTLHQIDG